MTTVAWILIAALGVGLVVALTVGLKRRAISLRPSHLKTIAGDIRNYCRFSATAHRRKMAELHRLIGLPPGTLPPTRGRAASPDFLLILARDILAHRPAQVLECGAGVSTLVIAQTLKQIGQGRLLSLEHLDRHAATVTRKLKELGLADYGTVVSAPLVPHTLGAGTWQWYDITVLPSVRWDLIVVDGPPASVGESARYPVGPLMVPSLSAEGRILVDDTNRPHDRAVCDRLMTEFDLDCTELPAEKGCRVLYRASSESETEMSYIMPA